MDDLVQQFLGSGAAASAIQALTTQHGLTDPQARQAVQATAEGSAKAIGAGNFDLGALAGAIGGGGLGGLAESLGLGGKKTGGLPTALVQPVTDYVTEKTGLPAAVVSTVVGLVLPKVIEFAKGMMAGSR